MTGPGWQRSRRPARLADTLDEKEWQADVVDAAAKLGWHRRYHTFDARRSQAGFPDLVLVRRPRLIFAELKTETGKLSYDQQDWLDDLDGCVAESYVWRPSDRFDMDRILTAKVRDR